MESHSYLEDFGDEDLISFESKEKIHRVSKLKSICQKSLDKNGRTAQGLNASLSELNLTAPDWMDEGVECEILKLGDGQWSKGRIKIRVVVDFYPDQTIETASEPNAFDL
jgi:KGK domain